MKMLIVQLNVDLACIMKIVSGHEIAGSCGDL